MKFCFTMLHSSVFGKVREFVEEIKYAFDCLWSLKLSWCWYNLKYCIEKLANLMKCMDGNSVMCIFYSFFSGMGFTSGSLSEWVGCWPIYSTLLFDIHFWISAGQVIHQGRGIRRGYNWRWCQPANCLYITPDNTAPRAAASFCISCILVYVLFFSPWDYLETTAGMRWFAILSFRISSIGLQTNV